MALLEPKFHNQNSIYDHYVTVYALICPLTSLTSSEYATPLVIDVLVGEWMYVCVSEASAFYQESFG